MGLWCGHFHIESYPKLQGIHLWEDKYEQASPVSWNAVTVPFCAVLLTASWDVWCDSGHSFSFPSFKSSKRPHSLCASLTHNSTQEEMVSLIPPKISQYIVPRKISHSWHQNPSFPAQIPIPIPNPNWGWLKRMWFTTSKQRHWASSIRDLQPPRPFWSSLQHRRWLRKAVYAKCQNTQVGKFS